MGLNGVNFGIDYAAKFRDDNAQMIKENQEALNRLGITVPINTPKLDADKGLKVEANPNEVKDEQPVEQPVAQETLEEKVARLEKENAELKAAQEQPAKPELEYDAPELKEGSNVQLKEEKTLYNKENRQARQQEVADNYREQIAHGDLKLTEKAIEDEAEYFVKNEERGDDFDRRHVVEDKAERRQLKQERKEEIKELRQQYEDEGLSRREAKHKAEAQVIEIKKLRHGAEKAMSREENRELFYDENGKISEQKVKEFVLNAAQRLNKGATDFRLTNEEAKLVAEDLNKQGYDFSAKDIRRISKNYGMSTEINKDALRAGVIVGTTAVGTVAGLAIGPVGVAASSVAGAAAGAAAGATAAGQAGAESGAAAEAGVELSKAGTALAGGVLGLGLGSLAAHFIKDEKSRNVIGLRDYTVKPEQKPDPIPEPTTPDTEPETPQPVVVTPEPEQDCPTVEWDADTCEHKVKPGSSWAYYTEKTVKVNNKPISGKQYVAYLYAQQLMYNIKDPKGLKENRFLPVGATYVEHSDFSRLFEDEEIMKKYPILKALQGAEITFDCDGVPEGKIRAKRNPNYRFGGFVRNGSYAPTHFEQGCNDNVPRVIIR